MGYLFTPEFRGVFWFDCLFVVSLMFWFLYDGCVSWLVLVLLLG